VLKTGENLWVVRAPPGTPLRSSQRSPDPLVGGEWLAAPFPNPTPGLGLQPQFSALRASFGSLPPTVVISHPMLRGLDKTLFLMCSTWHSCRSPALHSFTHITHHSRKPYSIFTHMFSMPISNTTEKYNKTAF